MPHRPWCSCVEKPHDDAAIKNPTGVNQWGFNLVVEYSTPDDAPPVVLLQISQNMLSGGV